jgi:hypothetical protein
MPTYTRWMLVSFVLLAGCANRGLRFPGSVRHMGAAPDEPYADRVQPGDADSQPAVADKGRSDKAGKERSDKDRDAPPRGRRGDGSAVAKAAGQLVGQRRMTGGGETHRFDCSGMVEAAYARAGWDYRGSSKNLYDLADDAGVLHKKKRPHLGDVVFWDNTYDRNKNGRRDDSLTHVGVVEAVLDDDTVRIVHLGSRGVVRIAMNLRHPHERHDAAGAIINSYVRASRDARSGGVLSGELFRGFASLWKLPKHGDATADAVVKCLAQTEQDA